MAVYDPFAGAAVIGGDSYDPFGGSSGGGGSGGPLRFVGNLAGDVKDALYGIIPGTVHFVEHPIRGIEQIKDSYAQTYGPLFKGHFGEFAHNLEEHPLGPILDLATVLDLGSTSAARLGLASREPFQVMAKYGDVSAPLRETRGHPLSRARGMAYQSFLDSPLSDRLPFFNSESRYGAAMNREKRKDLANREIYARPFAKAFRALDDEKKKAAGILANWTHEDFVKMADEVMAKEQEGKPLIEEELNVRNALNDPEVMKWVENPDEELDKVHTLWHDLADYDKNLLMKYDDLTEAQAHSRRFLPNVIATGGDFYSVTQAAKDVEDLSKEWSNNSNKIHQLRLEMEKGKTRYARGYGASQKRTATQAGREGRLRARVDNWANEAFGVDTEAQALDNLLSRRKTLQETIPERPELQHEVFNVDPESLLPFRRYEPYDSPANRATERDVAENGITEPLVLSADPQGRVSLLDSEDNVRLNAARKAGLPSVPVRFERITEHAPTKVGDFEPGQLAPEQFSAFNLDKPELRNVTDLHQGMVDLNAAEKRKLEQEVESLRQTTEQYKQNLLAQHGITEPEPVTPGIEAIPPRPLFGDVRMIPGAKEKKYEAYVKYEDGTETTHLAYRRQKDAQQFAERAFQRAQKRREEALRGLAGASPEAPAEAAPTSGSRFYTHKNGSRIWVTSDGRVRVWQKTYTSNPNQPPYKWIQAARTKDPEAYAAKKVSSGEWTPEAPETPKPAEAAPAELEVKTEKRHVPVTRGGVDMGTEQNVKIVGEHMIASNKTRGGGDVYGHKPIWFVRDAKTGEGVRGGFRTQREAIEWSKKEQRAPEPRPELTAEPAFPEADKALPPELRARIDKIEADLQKELKPLLAKIKSHEARIEKYSRGGGEKLGAQAEAAHRRHMEEIDRADREIEKTIKLINKKIASQVYHTFGMNELEKIADSLTGERGLRLDLYQTRKAMIENIMEKIDAHARRMREIERDQPAISRLGEKGFKGGWSEDQIANHLNEKAGQTDNPFKASILRRGPAYMPITDFQRNKMTVGEQFTSLLGRMRGKAHKAGEAPSEYQVQGGSYPQAGISSPLHQNRGTMLKLGRFILGQDTLTPQFMQSARYAFYRDLHAALLAAAHEGDRPGPGEVLVRRISPTGDVERPSHIPVEYMRKAEKAGKSERQAEHEYMLGEEGPGPMTTAKEEEAAQGPSGRYMIVSKKVADNMMGEFKKADYFAQNFVEKPMTVWRHLVLNMSVRWLTNNALGLMMMYALKNMGAHGLAAVLDVARQTKGAGMVERMMEEIPNPALRQEIADATRVRQMGMFSQHATPVREPRETITRETARVRQPGLSEQWVGKRFGGQLSGTFIQAQELDKKKNLATFLNLSRPERWLENKARMMQVNASVRKHLDLPAFDSFARDMDGNIKHIEDLADEQLDRNPELIHRINQEVDDAMGNYLSLNVVERRIIRRFMPFYAWYKAIGRVAWRLAVDDPLKANVLSRLSQISNEAQKDKLGGLLPDYLRGALVFGSKDKPWIINATRANPFESINEMLNFAGAAAAGRPGEMGKSISGLENPFLTSFIEAMSGKNLFFGNQKQGYPIGFANIPVDVLMATPQGQAIQVAAGYRQPESWKSIYGPKTWQTELGAFLGLPYKTLNMGQLAGRLQQ